MMCWASCMVCEQKKIADSSVTAQVSNGTTLTDPSNLPYVKIAQIIEDVKDIFPDPFSKDIYAHFNVAQKQKGKSEDSNYLSEHYTGHNYL